MSSWFSDSISEAFGDSSFGASLGSSVSSSTREQQQPPPASASASASVPPPLPATTQPVVDSSAPSKTIYLIRHAESEENVKLHGLQEVGMSLYERRLPSSKDLTSSLSLIGSTAKGEIDSQLSEHGKQQIQELHAILEKDSQKQLRSLINDVDVVGHSPLIRARETCYGALGLDRTDLPENVFNLSCLEEATPWETVVQGRKNTVHKRIEELKAWIESQNEAATIVLVGHSEYFMIMLGTSRAEKFWNCDVWKVQYQSGGRWTGLELKHRLSSSKPMGIM